MEAITFEQLPAAITNLFQKVANIERLLQQKAEPQPEADQLLTIQQAAQLLNLSVPTIYSLVSRAEVPVNKRGKRLYFSKQELTHWIKEGRKKTNTEIQAEAQKFVTNRKKQ